MAAFVPRDRCRLTEAAGRSNRLPIRGDLSRPACGHVKPTAKKVGTPRGTLTFVAQGFLFVSHQSDRSNDDARRLSRATCRPASPHRYCASGAVAHTIHGDLRAGLYELDLSLQPA